MNASQIPVVMTRMPGVEDYLLLLAIAAAIFSAVVTPLVLLVLAVVRRRRDQPGPDVATGLKLFFGLLGGALLATLLFFALV
jgi:hypothetical protein